MLALDIHGHPSRRTQTAPLGSDDAAQYVSMRTDSTLNPAQSSRLRGCLATDQPDMRASHDKRHRSRSRA